ncbi:MAG TPA: hypothetical protein VMG10_18915 [Gemmataceae bacterium]|nr:hypothetical protein [Gemmataceae bacterium]
MADRRLEDEGQDDVTRLQAEIQDRLHSFVRDFRMALREGGWFLYGHARTYYAKQLAQQRVMMLSQLPIRANEIQVD